MSKSLALMLASFCLAVSCAAVADDEDPTTQERVSYALSRALNAAQGDKHSLASLQTDAALDAAAEFGLGVYYSLTKDYPQSLTWFKKSADQHFVGGYYGLGRAYDCGKGVPKDYTQAMRFYLQATELSEADMRIGDMYMDGDGVAQDDVRALSWYQKAADAGSIEADLTFGHLYELGIGVKQDSTQALQWYRKAADLGNAEAQYQVGSLYGQPGSLRDYKQAALWYQKASQQGVAEAQFYLGHLYLDGNGVAVDKAKAVQQFQMAANQGYRQAQVFLATCFADGVGVPADPFRAYQWYAISEMSMNAADSDPSVEQRMTPLAQKLGPTQTARAKQAAQDWHDAHSAAKPAEFSF